MTSGKKSLTDQDIRSQYISPAITGAGWDQRLQIREEVSLTAGRVIVRGKLHTRGKQKRADRRSFAASVAPRLVNILTRVPLVREHFVRNVLVLCDELEATQHRNQGQRLMQSVVESLVT